MGEIPAGSIRKFRPISFDEVRRVGSTETAEAGASNSKVLKPKPRSGNLPVSFKEQWPPSSFARPDNEESTSLKMDAQGELPASQVPFLNYPNPESATSFKLSRFKSKNSSGISDINTPNVSQCPTITSIQTIESTSSLRDSDLLKPVPRRSKQSIFLADIQHAENSDTELVRSPTPSLILHGKSTSFDSPRKSPVARKSAPLEGKPSDIGAHLRKMLSSSSPDGAGLEPVNKNRRKLFSSSSSSTTETDDSTATRQKSSNDKGVGTGTRLSLRLFEKKENSKDFEVDDSNPWFQRRSMDTDEAGGLDVEFASKHSKEKKKRLKKLGMKFRKDTKDRATGKQLASLSSSSSDTLVSTLFPTDEALIVQNEKTRKPSIDHNRLEENLKQALSEKPRLESVMEQIILFPERPREELCNLLYRFLSTNGAIERGMKIILSDNNRDDGRSSMSSLHRSGPSVPYREVLVHNYVTGPSRLRKAILQHSKARGELLSFLGDESQQLKAASQKHSFKIHCVARILNSLLAHSPQELTEYVAAKKGLLQTLVSNHIHVPEVVDFVCQLCAANALSAAAGDELRYGAPNAPGIVLLFKEEICNLLVQMFSQSSRLKTAVPHETLRWQVQVMSIRCLLELNKRCIVVPRFSKANCSYNGKYIKAVNAALENINSFENLSRVDSLLEAAFQAVPLDGKNSPSQAEVIGNNAGVCVLTFVTEVLGVVDAAVESRSVVTQRTVGSTKTEKLEQLLLSKTAQLSQLLESRYSSTVKGRLKIAVVKTFRSLFSSRVERTRETLSQSGLADRLLHVLRENKLCTILHGCIVECLSVSMHSTSTTGLHKAWFKAMQVRGGLMDDLASMLEENYGHLEEHKDGRMKERCTNYRSTVLEIGFMVSRFSQNLTRGEFRALFDTEERYLAFTGEVEQGLRMVQEGRRGACGGPKPEARVVSVLANAESLAARLDDVDAV